MSGDPGGAGLFHPAYWISGLSDNGASISFGLAFGGPARETGVPQSGTGKTAFVILPHSLTSSLGYPAPGSGALRFRLRPAEGGFVQQAGTGRAPAPRSSLLPAFGTGGHVTRLLRTRSSRPLPALRLDQRPWRPPPRHRRAVPRSSTKSPIRQSGPGRPPAAGSLLAPAHAGGRRARQSTSRFVGARRKKPADCFRPRTGPDRRALRAQLLGAGHSASAFEATEVAGARSFRPSASPTWGGCPAQR